MDKLSPDAKKYFQSLVEHSLTNLKDISDLYLTQKSFADNHTEYQNYTDKVFNPAIKQKIWNTQMFLQKSKDLKKDVFNELIQFVQNEFYSENYKVKENLALEICKILPELTGSSEFKECHYD